jgi:Mrp family chromosome partitioning ATPase/capsular polysaccharide biosynthesis protein
MSELRRDHLQAQRGDAGEDLRDPARPKPLFGIGSFLRHARFIGACGLACLMLAGVAAVLKPTKYTASTQLLIYNRELLPGAEPVILKGRADVSLVQNEIELVQSRSVLTRVVEALDLDKAAAETSLLGSVLNTVSGWFSRPAAGPSAASQAAVARAVESLKDKLSIRRVGTSHAISIAVTESDPAMAAQIANEVARAYIQARAAASTPEASRDLALRERLQGLGPNAYVISSAEPPLRRDGPRMLVILALGLVAGLGIGGALALLRDFIDHTVRTSKQAEFMLGLDCLGILPDLAAGKVRQGAAWQGAAWLEDIRRHLVAVRKPEWQRIQERVRQHGAVREDATRRALQAPSARLMQTLRRAASLIATSPHTASIGITSTLPGEGRTSVAANLAWLLAGEGRKVLLLDAEARPASPAASARSASSSGRTAAGELARPDFVSLDRASGDSDAAWAAALEARVRESAKIYDLVIVDLPTLAEGPKVQLAARSLDAFLLVLRWGDTNLELSQQALHSSGKARLKFIGAILNFVDERVIGTYGDKLAAAQMALSAPDIRADRPILETPTTLPAGNATKANA